MENETQKITTKTYYRCGTCKKKMETIDLGGASDMFSFGTGTRKALYCDNKECEKFGYLTVVGIKVEE